jgi:two-component sensor histidine kinase
MVLHELAAEAARSGALSVPDGRIDIAWTVQDGTGDARRFRLRWQERGGSHARSPDTNGAALEFVRRIAAEELHGTFATADGEGGRRAELEMPFASELLRFDGASAS